jgi:hypothetical protein
MRWVYFNFFFQILLLNTQFPNFYYLMPLLFLPPPPPPSWIFILIYYVSWNWNTGRDGVVVTREALGSSLGQYTGYSEGFSWFSSVPPAIYRDRSWTRPTPLPSKPVLIHYSLILRPFDATRRVGVEVTLMIRIRRCSVRISAGTMSIPFESFLLFRRSRNISE